MENYYIVKEEIIKDNTFNESIILKKTKRDKSQKTANKIFIAMSKTPAFRGAIKEETANKKILNNILTGDSYIVEIEEYEII